MPTQNATEIMKNLPVPSDALQSKLIGMLDSIKNGEVVIGQETVKYAPDVVNAALNVVRIGAVQQLVYGVIGLVVAVVFFKKAHGNITKSLEDGRFELFLVGVVQGAAVVVGVVDAYFLVDVWNYVGIFQPKLYIAHKIVEKMLP